LTTLSALRARRWWRKTGPKFFRAQWRRVWLGCVLGGLVAIGFHVLLVDSRAAPFLLQQWSTLSQHTTFDGFRAYGRELVALGTGLAALVALSVSMQIASYIRSWWAGITSVTTVIAACGTIGLIQYEAQYPKRTIAAAFVSLAIVLGTECWRQLSEPHKASKRQLKLNVPVGTGNVSVEKRWQAPSSDDPIATWDEDLVGRAAVVELLAEHTFSTRTPIIALHGSLGDGKSSVLNLLRKAVEGKAIVVSFSAWLPGSEATFATDLFRDIANECRKYVHVPQLRKRLLTYARTVSGSVAFLKGLREVLPVGSQREEVEELRQVFSRVPLPILVLLDEIDRMQKEELVVLLKILRGASSIPNVTFVCAFSEEEIKRELSKDGKLSYDYLEKFFPVSVNLSPPNPEILGTLFQDRLKRVFAEQNWFRTEEGASDFAKGLGRIWEDSLSRVCTNFRKAGLLLNDILTSARPITAEVNPLDLTAIEATRRFYPEIYHLVRTNPGSLTYAQNSWAKGQYLPEDVRKKESKNFFEALDKVIAESKDPKAIQSLLSWLFPEYASANEERTFFYSFERPTSEEIAEDDKRVCSPDYFPIYFRAALPEAMFSNAELERIVSDLNGSQTETGAKEVFDCTLHSIPPKHPKREDFLWKLSRRMDRLSDGTAEQLAYAVADRAADYMYDVMNLGEASRALNLVFAAAQKVAGTPDVQRVLEGAMKRSSDDTFAKRILEYTDQKRNRILTDFSHVDVDKLKQKFIDRMRLRYGADRDFINTNIVQCDRHAFWLWVKNSPQDRENAQGFWRRYISGSRKRLAQVINVIYPGGVVWSENPIPILDELFPTAEFAPFLDKLPRDEALDDVEEKAIARMQELLKEGKYHQP